MRALVHDGCPLSTVADTLLGNIGFRNEALYNLKRTKKEWLCRLLTACNTDTHTDILTDSLQGSGVSGQGRGGAPDLCLLWGHSRGGLKK